MNEEQSSKEQSTNEVILFKEQISDLKSSETQYQLIQKLISQERSKFKKYLDIAGVILVAINSDQTVNIINKTGCEILGYDESEILGKNWFDNFIPEASRSLVKDTFIKLMSGETSLVEYFENSVLTKSGQEKNIQWHNAVLKDENNNIVATLSSGIDITELKNSQKLLQESEEKYRKLVDDAQDAILIADLEGNLLEVNKQTEKLFGYTKEELSHMKISQIHPPEEVERTLLAFSEIVRNGTGSLNDTVILRKDGKKVFVDIKGSTVEYRGKKVAQGIFHDITERKKMEQRIRDLNECFLKFGPDPLQNINTLVSCCGKLLGATCALYNRLEGEMLYSLGKWNTPGDFKDRDKAEGHICYDVIKRGVSDFLIIHNLEETPYVKTDPNVTQYSLKTYVGKAVGLGKDSVGSLCVVYQDNHDFSPADQRIMEIISLAIGVEEKRKQAEDELRKHRNNLEALVKERTNRIQELSRQTEFILGATKTGVDIIDSDFNIVYIDPEWQKVYGSPAGKKCYEYFMDRNSECPDCGIRKALETKTIIVTEEILKKENNRPIQVTTIPFQDKDGKWLVAEVNVDITEQKKIEEQLDKYRKHLESLVKERTVKLESEIAQRKNTEEDKKELTNELLKTNKKLKQLVLKDIHTGLFNHRYLEEIIDLEFHRAKRAYHPLSLILIDIDYFKSINDVYGHKFGDLVLKQFAIHLKRIVRRYDIIIRYGGEEFMILCPGTYRATALILTQRILDNIILENFGDGKYKVKMKLTLAVVSYPEDKVVNGMGLVEIVDKIMNKAKEHGGNRIYSSLDIKKKTEIIGNNIEEKGNVKILKEKLEKITKRANQGLAESIFAFTKTIELKDHYTGEHVEKTVQYATEIARVLDLSKDEIERIRQAAMVHDLGKIGISEKILLKKAKLTKKEFEVIKNHPQIGVDIIRPIQFLHDIIPLIFYHHERWDGKGYPSGLKGEEIPFGARIIALADVYQALTSNRPYRKAYSKQKALKIIKASSGTQFDPNVVNAFLKILKQKK